MARNQLRLVTLVEGYVVIMSGWMNEGYQLFGKFCDNHQYVLNNCYAIHSLQQIVALAPPAVFSNIFV